MRVQLLHASDLLFVLRLLRKRPVATVAIVASLAFAIGIDAALFSVADQIFTKPLPVTAPHQLVSLYGFTPSTSTYHATSLKHYFQYEEASRAIFSGMAAYTRYPLELKEGQILRTVSVEEVTGNYFDVLQVRPLLGRLLTQDDDREQSPPVVVLSEKVWRSKFDGDPGIVGRTIVLSDQSFTVVGVAPRAFRGILLDWVGEPQAWITLTQLRPILPPATRDRFFWDDQLDWVMVVGRLSLGVTVEQALARAAIVAEHLPRPSSVRPRTAVLLRSSHAKFWPGSRDTVLNRLTILITGGALLLVLACLNVATLLLERAIERRHEIALRLALGAGRWRVARLMLLECAILAAAGCLGALLVARFVGAFLTRAPHAFGQNLNIDMQIDMRTFAICTGIALFVMVACALVPVWSAMRASALCALRSEPRVAGATRLGSFARNSLVATQISLSTVVLVAAGVLMGGLVKAGQIPVGFDSERLLFATLEMTPQRYTPQTARQFAERVTQRLLEMDPAITAAAATSGAPLSPVRTPLRVSIDAAGSKEVVAEGDGIDAKYVETLGVPLLDGRAFDRHDHAGAPARIIVNHILARQLWGDISSNVGRHLWVQQPSKQWKAYEVVGITANERFLSLWEDRPRAFLSLPQSGRYATTLIVRTRGNLAKTAELLRQVMGVQDPRLPQPQVRTWSDTRDEALVPHRVTFTLFAAISLAMLLVTVIGLYAVMNTRVLERRKEIGVRIALGAAPDRIRNRMFASSAALAGLGIVPGIVGGTIVSRAMSGVLSGLTTSSADVTLWIVPLLIVMTALATLGPARRAASIDPMLMLKDG